MLSSDIQAGAAGMALPARRLSKRTLGALFACALLYAALPAPASGSDDGDAVIAPGAEAVLGEMLGNGATLPGGCTFESGNVERTVVRGTYKCDSAEVVFELSHPSKAPRGAVLTQRFALSQSSGTTQAALRDDLAARIRAKEAGFNWTIITPRIPPRGSGSSRASVPLLAAAVVGIGLLLWLRARRRRPAPPPLSDS